ncbi:MAG: NYN domain-containing protein [Candidatus Aenigmarchaeota archaeon]|nr:NYN domain-containing protein [Candidatus Aenigmarchaeota archaeon]
MFRKKQKEPEEGPRKNLALFVDGPNIIRKEFSINLDDLRRAAQKYGRIMIGKVFLNQYASEKLIEAISNQGLEAKIMLAGESSGDVDVAVAVASVKAAYNRDIDIIAIASRDADYLPVVHLIKEMRKKVVIIGVEPGFSKALQNAADFVEMLPKRKALELP